MKDTSVQYRVDGLVKRKRLVYWTVVSCIVFIVLICAGVLGI